MDYVSPQRLVEITQRSYCQGTSISFNEPTLSLEWSLDVFRIARKCGLYNTYVTNGYMTPEALSTLIEAGLDAMNVDIKGNANGVKKHCKGIDVEKVWDACKQACESGIHLEITTLVIPTVNDAQETLREIAERIVRELSPQVPWHVSGYYPAYRFNSPPTPVKTLESAWKAGKEAGLEFVYIGNLPGHRYDNTYCPNCDALLIGRMGFDVLYNHMRGGRCPKCGQVIAGVWSF
jgi:pyruvate formate lyase activating enzyme